MGGGEEASEHRRTFRFFRAPGSERVVARDEFDSLETHGRAALAEAIGRFRRYEELPGEVKKLKGKEGKAGLWEIRVKVGRDPFRALFFYDTDIIVVCLTVFYKNQQETPKQDLKRALARKATWESEGKRREAS
jgi:phage-related protein